MVNKYINMFSKMFRKILSLKQIIWNIINLKLEYNLLTIDNKYIKRML